MSGITGLLRLDGIAVDDATVQELTETIAHRGPDGSAVWTDGTVGLGHQHLCTTTEGEAESLPRRRGRRVLTADARLDNRAALMDRLDVDGDVVTDSELILAAYDRWGTDCAAELRGAFALALWDGDRRRLFCVRDHMGVKPLYYSRSGDRFAVASEIKALLRVPGIDSVPDDHRIGDYLAGRFPQQDRTFYRDVSRLLPGHTLTVSSDGLTRRQYWSVDSDATLDYPSDAAYERRFRELFTDAVEARMRSNAPVGSFLSGGLDSSSIACVARDLLADRDRRLHTFSAVFDEITACDERTYIEAVLDQGGFEPHYVHGDRVPPLLDLDRHLRHQDQPFYPSLFMLIWGLLAEIEHTDVTVVLQGYGGDQTLGSNVRGYFRELLRTGRWRTLFRELRWYHDRYAAVSYRDTLWHGLVLPFVPGVARTLWHARYDDRQYLDRAFCPVDEAFAHRTGLADRLRTDAISIPPRTHRGMITQALTSGEPTFNLELNDMAAAAHGVEPRYPYFDRDLVEFCVALPAAQNVADGLGRMIARNGLTTTLPAAVRGRDTKTEFSPNVIHGVQSYELSRIEETLFAGSPLVSEYLPSDALERAYDRVRTQETSGNSNDARLLLMATTLERWLRNHTSL